jgi:6-phosphogluconate dehydrogenase
MKNLFQLGLIGLGVMGSNLALNFEEHNCHVTVFNKESEWTERFMAQEGKIKNFTAAYSIPELVRALPRPRKIILMITAGKPVDQVIESLLPYLESGDMIFDCGNSFFQDTARRAETLSKKGIEFMGVGVSGGAEGARRGPSIMPGGSQTAYNAVGAILKSISAKTKDGSPCCTYIGSGGAGHFVKMVHNGIEYTDMQLISEGYYLMRDLLGLSDDETAEVFEQYNCGRLNSYLYEITHKILRFKDKDGKNLIQKIIDTAGAKGTGCWTAQTALEEGVSLPVVTNSVFTRSLSMQRELRREAARIFPSASLKIAVDKKEFLSKLENALYASKLIAYAQGFSLMKQADIHYGWKLDLSAVASVWRGGCIIRSIFLDDISAAYQNNPDLSDLLFDPYFADALRSCEASLREICILGIQSALSLPCLSSALSYFDLMRTEHMPTNLISAQRDFFGAHTYQKQGETAPVHTDWQVSTTSE